MEENNIVRPKLTKYLGSPNVGESYNLVQEAIQTLVKRVEEQKKALILKRILERTGETINLEKEVSRMFPRIRRVIDNSVERWYWNSGEESPILIIGFHTDVKKNDDIDILSKPNIFSISFRIE